MIQTLEKGFMELFSKDISHVGVGGTTHCGSCSQLIIETQYSTWTVTHLLLFWLCTPTRGVYI